MWNARGRVKAQDIAPFPYMHCKLNSLYAASPFTSQCDVCWSCISSLLSFIPVRYMCTETSKYSPNTTLVYWKHNSSYMFRPYWGCTRLYILFVIFITKSTEQSLLEKLAGPQLVKKFPSFFAIGMFITTFTRVRLFSLFWARRVQYTPSHSTFKTRFNIILLFTPTSSKPSISIRFPYGLWRKIWRYKLRNNM